MSKQSKVKVTLNIAKASKAYDEDTHLAIAGEMGVEVVDTKATQANMHNQVAYANGDRKVLRVSKSDSAKVRNHKGMIRSEIAAVESLCGKKTAKGADKTAFEKAMDWAKKVNASDQLTKSQRQKIAQTVIGG